MTHPRVDPLCHVVLILLVIPTLISSEYGARSRQTNRSTHGGSEHGPPFSFADRGENVTVQVGGTAYLHCPLFNLGERQLNWVRRHDFQILTHGLVTFTSDGRFQLVKERAGVGVAGGVAADGDPERGGDDDWALQIKHVVARDTGVYECQVIMEDGSIRSRPAELKVVTPEAFILAEEEYHIDRGSSLSLVCIIEKATTPPQFVFWYHNDRMINYDSERGISVTTTPGRKTHSQLFIQRADVSDSGNYTCKPSSSLPATITVFVSGSEVKPWTTNSAPFTTAWSMFWAAVAAAVLTTMASADA